MDNYLLVHKSIVPEYYEKVIEARRMLENGKARDVSQAVRSVGISRSTYYKYKDYILEPSEMSVGRRAVLSMMLMHEPGGLSSVLTQISSVGGSVLTITQSLPVREQASVTLSLDVGELKTTISDLMAAVEKISGVEQLRLLAIE